MKEKYLIRDMPKIPSPFEREMISGKYILVPKLKKEFQWIFSEECSAIEKLDGSNISIVTGDNTIKHIFNRMKKIDIWAKGGPRFAEGIQEAIRRNYLNLKKHSYKHIFGELVGPSFNGNPYKLDKHLWFPFYYLRERYEYKFWKDVIKECEGKTDNEKFLVVEEVFKELWSLMKRKFWGSSSVSFASGNKLDWVNENIGFEKGAAEGIVFYRKSVFKNDDFRSINFRPSQNCFGNVDPEFCKAKIRRDMWSWWFENKLGREHKK